MSLRLNIGCGRNILEGWINIDRNHGPGVDLRADLDVAERYGPPKLPFDDNSVDEFLLSHIIEHIQHTLPLMAELHRIAKPGAIMVIRTPHGASDDAWEDPTHVRPYFPNSFGYFSQPFYWRADYDYLGDWQVDKVILMVRSADVTKQIAGICRNAVIEMIAELHAVKPIREPKKELQEPLNIELVSA